LAWVTELVKQKLKVVVEITLVISTASENNIICSHWKSLIGLISSFLDKVDPPPNYCFLYSIRTDRGKSWNFIVQNSRPWKVLEKA